MGILDSFYNKSFEVKRATSTTSTATDSVVAVYTGTCVIRPVTNKSQLFNESNIGKEYKMWCDESSNIRIGDTIVIDSVNYGVSGIPEFIDLEDSLDSHFEARIYKR